MAIGDVNEMKVKVFIKTYLTLKGRATASELATAINETDIGLRWGINSRELSLLLSKVLNVKNNHFLDRLSFVENSANKRVYYLKEKE